MEQYALSRTRIPPRLYRVQYENSYTEETDFGLTASDLSKFDYSEDSFNETVTDHVACYDVESPLISCFAHKGQAEDWMCRNWRTLGTWAQILEIDTKRLGHGYVYRVSRLDQEMGLDLWTDENHDDIQDEYLILHHINARAIVARRGKISVQPENSLPSSNSSELSGRLRSLSQASWTRPSRTLPLEAWYTASPSMSRVSSVFEGSNYATSLRESTGREETDSEAGFSRSSMPRLTAPGRVNLRASTSVSIPGSSSASVSVQDERSVDGNSESGWTALGSPRQTPAQSRESSVRSCSTSGFRI